MKPRTILSVVTLGTALAAVPAVWPGRSAPPPASDARIRDANLRFFTARAERDPRGALDLARVAALLNERARSTGSRDDLTAAERAARHSLENRRDNPPALRALAASLLVVRDGRLAFERYFNGFEATDANNVHSLTKSITSLLTGIAIDDGHLTLDTRIGDVLPPEVVGEHGDVTVEHLVTMSGGVEVPDPESAYEWEPGDTTTFLQHVLKRPRVADHGQRAHEERDREAVPQREAVGG